MPLLLDGTTSQPPMTHLQIPSRSFKITPGSHPDSAEVPEKCAQVRDTQRVGRHPYDSSPTGRHTQEREHLQALVQGLRPHRCPLRHGRQPEGISPSAIPRQGRCRRTERGGHFRLGAPPRRRATLEVDHRVCCDDEDSASPPTTEQDRLLDAPAGSGQQRLYAGADGRGPGVGVGAQVGQDLDPVGTGGLRVFPVYCCGQVVEF